MMPKPKPKNFAASNNQNQDPRQGQQLGLPMKAILSSHTYFELLGKTSRKNFHAPEA
jgi:hypothetical protein